METPNTRSRRKREMEGSSQEEGLSIAWVHDQDLRKAVLQATENDVIAPPTPTQKPRPISSRFSPSSSSIAKPSSRPARKRPCRHHRSLPTSISTASPVVPIAAGPSSLPSMSSMALSSTAGSRVEESRTRLDELLERFQLQSSPLPKKVGTEEGGVGNATPSRRGLRSREQQPLTRVNPKSPNIQGLTTNILTTVISGSSESILKGDRTIRAPLSPVKPGAAPRIGLGSQHHNPKINRTFVKTSSTGRAFKPPLLEPQGGIAVRSSPRRAVQSSKSHPPMRGPSNAAPQQVKRPTTNVTTPRRPANTSRGSSTSVSTRSSSDGLARTSGFSNYDVGEGDPAGDRSFDSFDGIFEQGGEEFERLMLQVDGAK
ncbi:hypothetical protein CI109_101774 [Kwoniella shandongensis]|uniref:Uncharacterized protein n=1 Tax=Kwoniella shandongensis TaxID=1734106 RepID=A0A5M6C5L8_9TREE|nr:uncharacterized protein CI109_001104 [Kwoniella shandongensis]KAA5530303.1 hypothetical protein CI109_001104 [Kwoniella shandongensis]